MESGHQIGALYHLSGDSIGKSKKREEKKANRKSKPKKKRVAKIALAPARASFLVVIELNLLKLGTKLARVWNAEGGKDRLIKWWKGIGGNEEKLKKAIAKGSKQTISGAQMGVVGATAIATATGLIIAVTPIIKSFKAGGDDKEKKEFDSGVDQGKKDLADDPDVDKTDQNMPEDKNVALIKKKSGEDAIPMGLHTNPISICFFMFIVILSIKNPILSAIATPFTLYFVIGFFVIPFSEFGIAGEKIKTLTRKYFDIPASLLGFHRKNISHGKA